MTLTQPLRDAVVDWARTRPAGKPLLVASDFDGVLAPLVDVPSRSRPTPAAAAAMAQLASVPDDVVQLALVSGRDLEALGSLSQAPHGTVLVGSHGAERGDVVGSGDDRAVVSVPVQLSAEQATLLSAVHEGLTDIAAAAEGAWVEAKPSAAVLHTRLVPADEAERATAAAATLGHRLGAHTMLGKNVVEIAVLETSKGRALTALRDELGAARVLYMGDDVTDETAFAALGSQDLTIRIGPGDTSARFRVENPDEAAEVLGVLAEALAQDLDEGDEGTDEGLARG